MVSTASKFPEISGYTTIEQIYQSSRTKIYRALNDSQKSSVVIKVLQKEYPTFGELLQFRNQYTITKNLPIPGIVKPLSLEKFGNGYALVMEDNGGISLEQYFEQDSLELNEKLAIAIQITNILHELHQHRVIHKDIKPGNILINPETKEVKLIDFSIASLLPKETQAIQNPKTLEGTLAYIAPEQTGRMNRGIDYRSDFYSFGITLYQLLTGCLPFETSEPLELLHYHIAQTATPVNYVNTDVPEIVGAIIAKLMAKNAEDRYQSALGIKYDLQQCLNQWQETGAIAEFELAQRDLCDRFIIPEKLYGRENEVRKLLDAFERVTQGKSEMMLVAGFSGIGKTAVVNEVHKPIVKQRGYFIKGKFDQFNRNIPLSAFVQAFRDLITQLLGESDTQLSNWKNKVLQALGDNGQVIIEVIPELAKIIGEQPPVTELFGNAAENRFNLLFQNFIKLFTTKEHPLVIFLDDLQWADSSSLKLMQLLMGESSNDYLLMIGAYRDNEVFPAHPLILTLADIKNKQGIINKIKLDTLREENINQLVADTLNCSHKKALPLTKLICQKTQGNPFFSTQFLKVLYQDDLIQFDANAGFWVCDIAKITIASLRDDVVELMALQLQKLPPETQNILKLAACIGNQFDLSTLAIISQQSEIDTASYIWKSLQAGLVLPTSQIYKFFQDGELTNISGDVNPKYRFLHDRVQQAAYSLIPKEQKQATHLKIGYQLWHHLTDSQIENHLFTIVNHLNIGCDLITDRKESDSIAKLNFQASQKAKISVAYESYRRYCYAGQNFLQSNSWEENYSLQFSLSLATIEAEYLNHNLPVAQELSEKTLVKATTLLDSIKVNELQILFAINQNQMQQAINIALDVLSLLDIKIPQETDKIQLETELLLQEIALPTEEIANLETLTTIADENKLAAIRILTTASSAAYIANPTIFPLIILYSAQYCMKYGNSPLAASVYSWYGALLCGVYNNIEIGYEFGKLSLRILEKFDTQNLIAKVSNMFNVFIRPWKEHLKNSLTALPKAISGGFENGDVEYAFYAAVHNANYLFYSGTPLEEVQQFQACYLPEIIKAKYEFHADFLRINQQVVNNLLGENETPKYLNGLLLNGEACLSQWLENNIVFLVFCFYEAQTRLAYLFEDYILALETAAKGQQYRQAALGTLYVSEHNFYYSLALLASEKVTSPVQAQITDNQKQLKIWANFSPNNFQHKYDLVEAEKCRILGQKLEAIELYDKAISGAKENEYLQEEALGNELAAKFYLDWGKDKVAAGYMQEAYYCYSRWEAKAKTDDLEIRYAKLLQPILQEVNNLDTLATLSSITQFKLSAHSSNSSCQTSAGEINTALDLVAIFKSAQILSETIELNELLEQLSKIMLQTSGAQRLVLMLPDATKYWQVRVMATAKSIQLLSAPLTGNFQLPIQLIQYVQRTQEILVVDGLNSLPVVDSYLQQNPHRSILCVPLLYRAKLVSVLYLEHGSIAGVFNRDRMTAINFLCNQAASSIENALLNQALEQKLEAQAAKLQESEARFRNIVENVPGVVFQFCITTDGTMSFPYISSDCYDIYEVTAEAIISGQYNLRDFEHSEDKAMIEQKIAETVPALQRFDHEFRIITPSGTIKWICISSQPNLQPNGLITGDGVIIDISDRKADEEKLKQTNAELARATRMKDEFLANMSHELRTPLNCILGMTESLKEEIFGTINSQQLNALDHLEFSSNHLLKLINDILDLSKLAAEKMELETEPTDLMGLCKSSLQMIQQQAQKKNIQLQTTIPARLPPFILDEQRIKQVLINLLSNAIKFTPEGGQVSLNINSQPIADNRGNHPQDLCRITVSDTGIGISPENIEKLFKPFVQIDGALNRQYEGTGLGLALVKKIVELHGGRIQVESEVGFGSSFIVDIPCFTKTPSVSNQTLVSIQEPEKIESETEPLLAKTNKLILLAEDDEANVLTISTYLEAKGYHLVVAENGKDTIELLESLHPQVILMDIQMPIMDGLEATRYIRQQMHITDTPIIALTALAMKGDKERCLEAGANHYLSKPVKLKQLNQLLQQYL